MNDLDMAGDNQFDFVQEMIYGRKHLNMVDYSSQGFDFVSLVEEIFDISDLSQLHTKQVQEYSLFTEFGKDNNTEFHDYFYQTLKSQRGDKIRQLFEKFVREVVFPYMGIKEAMVQKFPTFRIQLPSNVAVALPHHDHELGHPVGEVNFIIALTKMWDSNTIWIEKMPRCETFTEMSLEPNTCISFNGNLCQHYNKVNETGQTRISMDFRILPLNFYFPEKPTSSLSTRQKFLEGGYYMRLKA